MEVALAQSTTTSDASLTEAAGLGEASDPDSGWSQNPSWIGTPLRMVQFHPRYAVQARSLAASAMGAVGADADCTLFVVPPFVQTDTPAPTPVEPRRSSGQAEPPKAELAERAAPDGTVLLVGIAVPETKTKDWTAGATASDWSDDECGKAGIENWCQVSEEPVHVEPEGGVSVEWRSKTSSQPQSNEIPNCQAAPVQSPSPSAFNVDHQIEPGRAVAQVVNQSARRARYTDDRMNPRQTPDTAESVAAGASDEESPAVFEALIRGKAVNQTREQSVPFASTEAAVVRRVTPGLSVRRHRSGSSTGEAQGSVRQTHVSAGGGVEAETSGDHRDSITEPSQFVPRAEDRPLIVSARPGTGTLREVGSTLSMPTFSAESQPGAERTDRAAAGPAEVQEVKQTNFIGELETVEGRGALREVALKVQTESGATVHLKFTERRGEVRVVSRTSDAVLGRDLAEGLPELKRDIEDSGMGAEIWASQSERLAVHKEAKAETRSGAGSDGRAGQGAGRDGQSGSRSGRDATRWADEIENSLDESRSGGTR